MCPVPACPVLMDYGIMWEFELTGEHNGSANHIISVSQVENLYQSDTSEIFSPTFLNINFSDFAQYENFDHKPPQRFSNEAF